MEDAIMIEGLGEWACIEIGRSGTRRGLEEEQNPSSHDEQRTHYEHLVVLPYALDHADDPYQKRCQREYTTTHESKHASYIIRANQGEGHHESK